MLLGHDNRVRGRAPAAEISRAEQHAWSQPAEAWKTDREAHGWQPGAGQAELRTTELSLELIHVFHLAHLGAAGCGPPAERSSLGDAQHRRPASAEVSRRQPRQSKSRQFRVGAVALRGNFDPANPGPRRRPRTGRRRLVSIDRSGGDRGDKRSHDDSACDWSWNFRLLRPRRPRRPDRQQQHRRLRRRRLQ
jgi:hypothetical protein